MSMCLLQDFSSFGESGTLICGVFLRPFMVEKVLRIGRQVAE